MARSPAQVHEVEQAINGSLRKRGGVYSTYSCKNVSWDDAQRGSVGGSLSCWGGNITDTRLWEKSGKLLFTVRSDNWNEKLGSVSTKDVAMVCNDPDTNALKPITLRTFLESCGKYGGYAGLPEGCNLSDRNLDDEVSIRFQTTFLPVEDSKRATLEFCTEAYNYNTHSDDDPRNLVLLCTTQGAAVQQDGRGAKKLYHHAYDPIKKEINRYWLEAERSDHKVGGAQKESQEEALDAASRGKATASVIGTRAMGTRFNVLMTIQVPLKQQRKPPTRGFFGLSYAAASVDDMMMVECCAAPPMASACFSAPAASPKFKSRARSSGGRGGSALRAGVSNAARVSRGSHVDVWSGLSVKDPKRDPSQHITVTVVIYNTVAGGVPTQEDVIAAIDDMENLYRQCKWDGRLADQGADFMKEELTVKDMMDIGQKVTKEPYKPPMMGLVQDAAVFPE